MDDLIAEFLTETNEALADLDTALVVLERDGGGPDTIANIFRMVHTVKGTSGFLGLARLGHVAHAAESLLGRYRDGEIPVTAAGITAILAALDCIRTILAALAETGAEPAGNDSGLLTALQSAERGEAAALPSFPADGPSTLAPPAPSPAEDEPRAAVSEGGGASGGGGGVVQAIRVSLPVLDDLMTLASELV
ncbi:MAG TPA: Hpt domain-containing protein, partial [Acetobacteraceae bacterium]|nr:Hpt domain-containing protein [Acetobacteraceae bacterium]